MFAWIKLNEFLIALRRRKELPGRQTLISRKLQCFPSGVGAGKLLSDFIELTEVLIVDRRG